MSGTELETFPMPQLRQLADGVRAALRIEPEDFTQVFDQADVSRGVVIARASLVNASRRTLRVQKNFIFERAAAGPGTDGGVRTLTKAGDDLIDAIVAGTAAGIVAAGK